MRNIKEKLETNKFWSQTDKADEFTCNDTDSEDDEIKSKVQFLYEHTILNTSVAGNCRLVFPFNITSFDSATVKDKYVLLIFGTSTSNYTSFRFEFINSLLINSIIKVK